MNRFALPALLCALTLSLVFPPAVAAQEDAEAIREVIRSAYIEGMQKNGSRDDIRAGFHPEFTMAVHRDGGVMRVGVEDWIGRLPAPGQEVGHEVTHRVPTVQVVDETAVAQVEVLHDGEHVFTDFMGLYRFPEGWRIVTKIFEAH